MRRRDSRRSKYKRIRSKRRLTRFKQKRISKLEEEFIEKALRK